MLVRNFLVVSLSLCMVVQSAWAQGASPASGKPSAPSATPPRPGSGSPGTPDYSKGAVWWPNFTRVYRSPYIAEVNMANSDRLERLLRDGNLYLSLEDAMALALENNLDIAFMRYEPLISDADILRAKAGSFIRSGLVAGATTSSQSTGASAATTGISTGASSGGGLPFVSTSTIGGPAIPQLDPVVQANYQWIHQSFPQTSNFITGTNTLIQTQATNNVTFAKSFLTGTALSLALNNRAGNSNNIRNIFNPALNSSATLNFQQSLTQGFGRSVNSRMIRIARNNREASDLAFKQQVIQTVAQVQNLYWDLVSFNENVRVAQQALALAEKLYNDNKRQVEIGTLAPIEIVRAEAEVASRQQDLTVAQTNVKQQETILLNALTKSGVASPTVAEAHVITTTPITVPQVEPIEPIQDLMSTALQARPELAQSRIRLTNADISLKATRNALLPTVNLVGTLTNNALAGQVNPEYLVFPGTQAPPISGFFLGGFGTNLSQIFARNFPDYGVGFQVNVPLKNRSAQADVATAGLQYRESEIRLRQAENAVRVEVKNALIGLQQSRARLDAAVKSRVLQEQTLDAEQKKYALGASTIFLVIQAQRDLATARSLEVTAMNNYTKAHVEMDRATGMTLTKNNISVDEAYTGNVSKPPAPLPTRKND